MMLIRITGSQLHAARVLVGLSREEVAERGHFHVLVTVILALSDIRLAAS